MGIANVMGVWYVVCLPLSSPEVSERLLFSYTLVQLLDLHVCPKGC